MYELRSFSANRRHRDLTAARMVSCQLTILPASFDLYLLFLYFFEVFLSWVRIPPGIAQRCLPCTTGDLLFPIRSGGGRGRGRGIVSNFVIMGRAPCCDKANVKRGPWSPEEDATLKSYVQLHGTGGNWIALPHKAGLRRCGKSCRLRWLNYLRPDIKHGGFTEEEDNVICSLYGSIGSRWSIIAAQLPGRTDNDIKNYWNTRLKKKLLGKCKDQRTARRLNSAAAGGAKQLESVLSASASPASSVSAPAHDDHISSSAAAAFSYSDLDPAGIAPSVNVEQSSSPLTKMSAAAFANTQEKYAFEGSALANMLLTTTVGDDYSLTKGINYTIPPAALASQNASIGHILSPSSWDIHAGQPHEDAQNMYEVAKFEPSPPVLDQNGWPAASMALWESCCSASRGTNYTESSWLNGLAAPDDPHHAARACESLTPAELNEILYCNGSLMHPKEEPTDYYALQNGFIRDADAAYCNTSSPKSSVTCCPNYSDNYILLGSATDEGITSQGVFHEGGVNY